MALPIKQSIGQKQLLLACPLASIWHILEIIRELLRLLVAFQHSNAWRLGACAADPLVLPAWGPAPRPLSRGRWGVFGGGSAPLVAPVPIEIVASQHHCFDAAGRVRRQRRMLLQGIKIASFGAVLGRQCLHNAFHGGWRQERLEILHGGCLNLCCGLDGFHSSQDLGGLLHLFNGNPQVTAASTSSRHNEVGQLVHQPVGREVDDIAHNCK